MQVGSKSQDRLPDIYIPLDYPVLLEVGRWMAGGRQGGILPPGTIADSLGRDHPSVIESVGRLRHAGYLDAEHISAMGGEAYIIKRLTAQGLRECGLWPTESSLADVLKAVLEQEAREAERNDPDKGRKIRQVLEIVSDLGTSFSAKLAGELLRSTAGIP